MISESPPQPKPFEGSIAPTIPGSEVRPSIVNPLFEKYNRAVAAYETVSQDIRDRGFDIMTSGDSAEDFHRRDTDETIAKLRKYQGEAETLYNIGVRNLTIDRSRPIPTLPDLEVNPVPARLDTPAAKIVPLNCKYSVDAVFNPEEAIYDIGFCPWKPADEDLEFFSKPENRHEIPLTPLDEYVRDLIKPVLDHEGIDFETWHNWCLSKKIEGTSLLSATPKARALHELLTKVMPQGIYGPDYPKGVAYIPTNNDLDGYMARRRELIEQEGYSHLDVSRMYEIVALARWDREGDYALYSCAGSGQINDFYRGLLSAMEMGVNESDPNHMSSDEHQIETSYAALVMGGRPSRYSNYEITGPVYMKLDYFDAFMLVAAEIQMNSGRYSADDQKHKEVKKRCLFGDHDEASQNFTAGLYMTMATMYFRMDSSQKEVYGNDIQQSFNGSFYSVDSKPYSASGLTTPGVSKIPKGEHVRGKYLGMTHTEMARELRTDNMGLLLYNADKFGSRIRVDGTHYDYESKQWVSDRIEGYKADEFYVTQDGHIEMHGQEIGEGRKLKDIPIALTTRERAGEKTALQVSEILKVASDGNLDKLSSAATLAEMTTGFDLPDRRFHTLTRWLSNITTQSGRIRDASRGEIDQILADCKSLPTFGELDELSQLMTIYAATGFLPKELVVERILSTAASASSLYAVRTAILLENILKSDLKDQGIDTSEYVSPIFQARERFQAEGIDRTSSLYKRELRQAIQSAMKLFSTYVKYDVTMQSPLATLVVGDVTDSLYAQCSAQSDMMVGLTKFMDPHARAYQTYREVDQMVVEESPQAKYHPSAKDTTRVMDLSRWFQNGVITGTHAVHDHLMTQVDFLNEKGALDQVLVVDQTSNHYLLEKGSDVVTDTRRTAAAKISTIDTNMRLRRAGFEDSHRWVGINYGSKIADQEVPSSVISNLLQDFPGLTRYRALANPDDIMLLRSIATSTDFPEEERIDAFRRVMQIAPRIFGQLHDTERPVDYVGGLKEALRLSLDHREYMSSIFLSNLIVFSNRVVPDELVFQGLQLRDVSIKRLASFDKSTLTAFIENSSDVLLDVDVEDIWREWDTFQLELEKAKAAKNVEAFVMHYNSEVEGESKLLADEFEKKFESAEFRQKVEDDSLGAQFTRALHTADGAKASQATQLNVATIIDSGPDVHFIELKPQEQRDAFRGIINGVPPERIPDILLGMQLTALRASEVVFRRVPDLAHRARQNLEAVITENGLTLPYSWDYLRTNWRVILTQRGLGTGDIHTLFLPRGEKTYEFD